MKYTVIKKRACSKVWTEKNGNKWAYISVAKIKEENVNHRDLVGDIPLKKGVKTIGELYGRNENQSSPIGEYREKLKYSEKIKGYIPCTSEDDQEGYVRVLGTAWGKMLIPILVALFILTGVMVAVWYFTRESGPPLDKSAIAYQMPNGLKNEDPSRIMLPGFSTLTMDAQTGEVQAALVNPEGNPCYFKYIIVLEDTGEELYRTDLLEPGTAVMEFTIDKDLEPGAYDIEIQIETGQLSDYTQEMNSGVVAAVLEVVEE